MHTFDLTGKTVFVTGASGGIGLALVKGFAEASANVVATDLNPEPVAAAMAGNDRVMPIALDVSDASGIGEALAQARVHFGPVDILINNAGVKSGERLIDGDRKKIQHTLSINTEAVLNLTRLVYEDSLKKSGGRIINIGSSISSRGAIFNYQAGGADYCYSKAIVHDLTQLLAYEAAPQGITVNAIAPGIIHTPMHGRPAEETEARHSGRIPLGRIGQPEDIVGAAVFLASEAAAYITGQVLHVNGGMVMSD
ncbi:MAG: SDR family oxidoreductase [Gammaproteobacteria bacterium]|jgi:NAD(P)-dependent dehydrogenase (short-subunit alcohol dehydrogenase family)|nr:SDR family oxidoreductase [Gammaproteobacteria bacterium]|tara:strand:+ start:2642 stop:3400 length:759 start_codon:yes stop_codon:yes gene_type:complete